MSKQKTAPIIAMITSFFLALIKFAFGILSGSMVVISSALDSLGDLFVSLINFIAIRKSEEPEDEDHNYGHGKIEGLAALFEGFMIAGAGISIIKMSVDKIIKKDFVSSADSSILLMLVVILITFFLARYLDKIAKETDNLVIKSDSLHYKTDLFTNAGVILSLIIIKFTGIKIIDPIVSILFSIYIIFSSAKIIKEGYTLLMDVAIDKEYVDKIIYIIGNTNSKIHSYHFLKTRASGKKIFIEFHLVFDKQITLFEAHDISDSVENQIRKIFDNKEVSIVIHLDPYDDSLGKQKFNK